MVCKGRHTRPATFCNLYKYILYLGIFYSHALGILVHLHVAVTLSRHDTCRSANMVTYISTQLHQHLAVIIKFHSLTPAVLSIRPFLHIRL